jgi:hypothetical protein
VRQFDDARTPVNRVRSDFNQRAQNCVSGQGYLELEPINDPLRLQLPGNR